MKNITKLILLTLVSSFSALTSAQELSTCNNYYLTSNAGWSNSEWYKIIDIDAATLTDATLPKFSEVDGSKNALNTDFASGVFTTPVYTYDEPTSSYVPTSVLWPINYYLAAFAPTMYTSAYSKVQNGANPSGKATTCSLNDNSIKQSAIYNKPGFIELSRQGSEVLNTPPSKHGYIVIKDLPSVERIQWSYSSTSYKRGVKCDINYNDGNGWIPQRWVASNYSDYEGSFSEQGYQFEEMINKQEDPDSKISIRFRIWDGDSIHYKVNANDLSPQATTYTTTMQPYAQHQTVRIHQIRVFSGIVPTVAPSAVKNINQSSIRIYKSGSSVVLSEVATVEMFSVQGQKVFSGLTDKIDVSKFGNGIFILKALDASGKMKNQKISL